MPFDENFGANKPAKPFNVEKAFVDHVAGRDPLTVAAALVSKHDAGADISGEIDALRKTLAKSPRRA